MKKLFKEFNLSWKKLIIFSIIIGIVTGLLNSIPLLKDTSITDPAIYLDLWILFGIFIILNSNSNLDSGLKCFIFFLISQPLIYLVEAPFSNMGWSIFTYYKYWGLITILCFPMGFIGYYLKKDKWYSLLILLPMLILLGNSIQRYLINTIFSFPRHLISILFCIATCVFYSLIIFDNKKIKVISTIISILICLISLIYGFMNKAVYNTTILCSSEDSYFDDSYNIYLDNPKYGKVNITNYDETYCIDASFKYAGKTILILEHENEVQNYQLTISRDTYEIKSKKLR